MDNESGLQQATSKILDMTLSPRLAGIAAAQGGVFTAAQAVTAGHNRKEIARLLAAGAWVRLRRGVYAEARILPDDDIGKHLLALRGAVLTLSDRVAASHVTSAVLEEVALLDRDLSYVHVTEDGGMSSRTSGGIRRHDASLPPSHLTKIDNILATTGARTVVDLARHEPFEAALVAAESALNQGITTLAGLDEVLAYCAEWPGARNASRVVAFASPYSESPGETLGRIAFEELGVPQPEQQVLIFDANGFIARSDYFWKKHHTVGEFDGTLKYTGAASRDDALVKEKEREDRLRDAGLEVFRIRWLESRGRAPSVRRKAFAAFDRAASSRTKRTYRFKLQPPPR